MVSKILPFLFLPVFTFYFTTKDFGIISTFKSLGMFLAPLIGLSSNAALSRHYWKINKKNIGAYLAGIISVILVSGVIIFVILTIFQDPIAEYIVIPKEAMYASFFYGLFIILLTIKLTLLQLQKRALLYAKISFFSELLQNLLAFSMIFIVGAIWESYLLGFLLSSFFIAFYALLTLFKNHKLEIFSKNKHFNTIVSYGSSYLVGALGVWTMNFSDRLFLNNLEGLDVTGVYAIGYTFGSLILMANVAFSRGWLPYFYENIENNRAKIVKVTYVYILVLFVAAGILSFLGPIGMKYIVDKKFWGGAEFISWIAFAYAINGIGKIFEGFLHYVEKPLIISKMYLITALLNLVLNYFLINSMGGIGAAIATLISFTFMLLILIIIVNNNVRMPWLTFYKSNTIDKSR